mgnify:CR=1 FL=1
MKNLNLFFVLLVLLGACNNKRNTVLDLSGKWNFSIDSLDRGEKEAWFSTKLKDTVTLPGSMAINGKGNNITMSTKWVGDIRNKEWTKDPFFAPYHDTNNIRFPYWLQPEKKYTGAAWYQKKIFIPENWKDKDVILNLERCHWETTVWLDNKKLGSKNSLSVPHVYSLKEVCAGKHLLSIKVDNRIKAIDVGVNSHSISDHTQSNWNGIVGDISLSSREKVYIQQLALFPDIQKKSVKVIARICNNFDNEKAINIEANASALNASQTTPTQTYQFQLKKGGNKITFTYPLSEDALLWNEFNPNLYNLNLQLAFDGKTNQYSETFGLREMKVEKGQITVNNRKIFLRGTLECAIFPKTGFPPTQKKEWIRIFRKIKSYGLNHMRFHSWCPPEAAFVAADELGVYLQIECASWANQSTTLGDGKPVDDFIWKESKRIVKEYGNHPSFCFMAYGNEPGGKNYKAFLTDFVSYWKKQDNRRLYTGAAGWPELAVNDYHDIPAPRVQGWGEQLNSIINGQAPRTNYDWNSLNKMPKDNIPVISHEIGQWCVYPDFKEIKKYTGVLKAKNFELFRKSLNANNMGQLADSFLLASGKLQALCYKADIEAALRTKNMGGFQLLDLHDFPGQGTALVGVLNPFWEEKGYITGTEYSRFCNSVVPLARLEKRIFNEEETLTAEIEIANFSENALKNITPEWKLLRGKETIVTQGTLQETDIPIGNGIQLGKIQYQFPKTGKPEKLVLEVSTAGYSNSWDIWIYPNNKTVSNDEILVTRKLDSHAIKTLNNGGKVLLSLGRGKVKEGKGREVGVGFSSIFWNTAWTDNQKPHTLGIFCNPEHPAFKSFPTEYYSNWQWWDAMSHADVINLNNFPKELHPVVRVIDTWFSNRPLGLVFEVKTGKGKLLVSGIDLYSNLDSRPEARQLLYSLTNYMKSDAFNPEVSVDVNKIVDVIK